MDWVEFFKGLFSFSIYYPCKYNVLFSNEKSTQIFRKKNSVAVVSILCNYSAIIIIHNDCL